MLHMHMMHKMFRSSYSYNYVIMYFGLTLGSLLEGQKIFVMSSCTSCFASLYFCPRNDIFTNNFSALQPDQPKHVIFSFLDLLIFLCTLKLIQTELQMNQKYSFHSEPSWANVKYTWLREPFRIKLNTMHSAFLQDEVPLMLETNKVALMLETFSVAPQETLTVQVTTQYADYSPSFQDFAMQKHF